jgi:hypothetical protein
MMETTGKATTIKAMEDRIRKSIRKVDKRNTRRRRTTALLHTAEVTISQASLIREVNLSLTD